MMLILKFTTSKWYCNQPIGAKPSAIKASKNPDLALVLVNQDRKHNFSYSFSKLGSEVYNHNIGFNK